MNPFRMAEAVLLAKEHKLADEAAAARLCDALGVSGISVHKLGHLISIELSDGRKLKFSEIELSYTSLPLEQHILQAFADAKVKQEC